jgi:predicted transcriptional regulator
MAGRSRREPGALERELFAAIAAAGRPLTPAEALAALDQPLAYTTVMSTLARLHDKGALSRTPAGRSFAYAPAVGPDTLDATLTARQMTRVLDRGANRAEALARFVADLGPDDERLLAELLHAHPRPGAGGTDSTTDGGGGDAGSRR